MNPATDDRLQEIAERWLRQHGQCHVNFVHWAIEDSEARVENLKAALREVAAEAVREEREALHRVVEKDMEDREAVEPESNGYASARRDILVWLDARSRAEDRE